MKQIEVALGDPTEDRVPPIGLCASSDGEPLDEQAITLLRSVGLGHLRVEARGGDGWQALASSGIQAAEVLGVPIELAILDESIRDQALGLVQDLPVARILALPARDGASSPRAVADLQKASASLRASIGGGTNAFFADLNRERPDSSTWDVVVYSISPQVHADDDRSVMETLPIQGDTVRSARSFCRAPLIVVSPITLRMRFNPDSLGPDPKPKPGSLPATVDFRQSSLFAAAWTLGSVASLVSAGVDGITYYETTGWHGVIERPQGSPLPHAFRSSPSSVFPAYHVLADACALRGHGILTHNLDPEAPLSCLAVTTGRGASLVLANRTYESVTVRMNDVAGAKVRVLDETTAGRAAIDPIGFRSSSKSFDGTFALLPYACAYVTLR